MSKINARAKIHKQPTSAAAINHHQPFLLLLILGLSFTTRVESLKYSELNVSLF